MRGMIHEPRTSGYLSGVRRSRLLVPAVTALVLVGLAAARRAPTGSSDGSRPGASSAGPTMAVTSTPMAVPSSAVSATPEVASCGAVGIVHGPWSLRPTESSVLVRWDACREASADLKVTREGGGAPRTYTGTRRRSVVRASYDTEPGVAPDKAGVRYLTEVMVDGLAPSTCYEYEVVVAGPALRGRFCTARRPGDSFVFLATGDTNASTGKSDGVFAKVLGRTPFGARPDLTLHLGDMQYYDQVVESYATWFPAMDRLLRAGAIAPAIGNHEFERPHEFEDYYLRLFGGAGLEAPVEHYRFQSGGIWFFSLDTELDLAPGSPQGKWLEAQLADAAAQPGHRASVVYFHKPWITLSTYPNAPELRRHYLEAFRKFGVRLVLQGHVHGYERFEEAGITYVVSGGGGAALHDLDVTVGSRPAEAKARKAHAKRHHGTVVRVAKDRFEVRAIADDGAVLDTFSVPFR